MADLEAPDIPSPDEAYARLVLDEAWPKSEIIRRLLDVLLWEARRYNGNEPMFGTETFHTRKPLPEGVRRQETWRAIFGEPRKEAPPGAWVQCPECRVWHVAHPGSDRSINDDDAAYIAEAMLRSRS